MPRPMSSQVIATQNQCSRRRKATRLRNNPPSSSRNSICRRRVSLEHRAGVSPGLSVLAWSRCLCASSVPDSSKTFSGFGRCPTRRGPLFEVLASRALETQSSRSKTCSCGSKRAPGRASGRAQLRSLGLEELMGLDFTPSPLGMVSLLIRNFQLKPPNNISAYDSITQFSPCRCDFDCWLRRALRK